MTINGDGFNPIKGPGNLGGPHVTQPGTNKPKSSFAESLKKAATSQTPPPTEANQKSEKLERLKAQIQAGTYDPDLKEVAHKLLQFMKDS